MSPLPHFQFGSNIRPQDEESRPTTAGTVSGHDIVIPNHLLQAATGATSTRDEGEPTNWEPRRLSSIIDNPVFRSFSRRVGPRAPESAFRRTLSAPSLHSTPAHSRAPSLSGHSRGVSRTDDVSSSGEKGHRRQQRSSVPTYSTHRSSRPLSYAPQTFAEWDFASRPAKRRSHEPPNSIFTDPFTDSTRVSSGSSKSSLNTDPFATRNNSISDGPDQHKRHSWVHEPESIYVPPGSRPRKGTLETIADAVIPDVLRREFTNGPANGLTRSSTMRDTYHKAKTRGQELQREKWAQVAFEYGIYALIILFIYFVLIGVPLWNGAVWWLYWVVANKFVLAGGFGITMGIALFYAFAPLFIFFEKDPPPAEFTTETKVQSNVQDTALLIPCYKSANLIAATLEAALKIFPPSHIYVIANGNSPTPLDNTEEVCQPYGVNHIWSPIGCKLVAQFVGCYAAKGFKNVLLIDDDCALPENFPVVTDRLKGNVMCLGYTIKSVGPNSSKGNYCQQAQDLEYKLSGLQREFAGKIGSATFPHGAIALWDRKLLVKTFNEHPGFSVSEDWFFGHVARELGSRITMCSQVFVETETPTAVFFSSGGSRGGFGEMTIFKQRFKRWNFFFVNGMYYNMKYILCSWKLGWWEIGAKIFVFQEVYETLLYLLTPFILPISFYVRPAFCGLLLASTIVMYLINTIIFNEVHLRRKNERIGWVVVYLYYLPYKIILTAINVASCYWSLYKYARYFAKRHPKVTEDEKAVEVVVRLEEDAASKGQSMGRHLTVRKTRDAASPGVLLAGDEGSLQVPVSDVNRGMAEQKKEEHIGAMDFANQV